ncbi:MAG: iron chelate uptake ABC transporter family permease subunit [Armatimonadetes bacterium]|nr:iron chelate uptake ABC transporter family permease subunit [Armatimonadota bacterium]NIM23032.1 iron chelate uptake ABC transporter family permease subunit [Armatimonadota bacterium]NIM66900.1 iron chelate uptake ABC transporter family permease subunit [Armatimonadota bacterium]NIM75434.1 iron chelate uptake ABC transporter family permease subunit [Armatimonadota bacterium]NIN05091.1 iron chelate uptake ABC transporter family permease subunit [Armatimonadota bacterium]
MAQVESSAPTFDTQSSPPAGPSLLARLLLILLGLGLFLIFTVAVAAGLGAVSIPPADLFHSIVNRLGGAESALGGTDQILWGLRLPRIALGAIVGAALAIAGGALQGLLLNPLADPYLIGVSAGAALGASVAIRVSDNASTSMRILSRLAEITEGLGRTLAAFAAAIITLLIVYRLALKNGRLGRESFILAGVVVGSFMWALVTLIMATSHGGQLTGVVTWLLGNLTLVSSWTSVGVAGLVVLAGALGLYAFSRDLNLIALGEEPAKQLGVEVERLKKVVILLAALLTAAAVSVSGVIGFVGLIIPHMARRMWGPDHRILLPASALLGASFLVWADTLARVASELLPVGVITSLLGAPFFCYLLVSGLRRSTE